ncbi:GGDEF domain-containing protein [Nakamurella flavida]|uniref:GGDEF domain-containing protein n=1 Tax=Nakamurella flavida TaxID=363630 RepID=A0A938YJ60_9ACTN|nr:GGDEF domain-containing protein [Nakamurella flavida]MBM9475571.1 GGDEF domain-containing protein [Nakamurella flavida]MDP9778153.1 diguanylate cyclase (GGDEF)-like protein [Nakamurella flavida]
MTAAPATQASRALIALGGLAFLLFLFVPLSPAQQTVGVVGWTVAIGGVTLAGAVGKALFADRVWRLLLAGVFVQLAGTLTWVTTTATDRTAGTQIWLDAVFLVGYALVAAGLITLVHRRDRHRDLPALLDAAVVTVAAGGVLYLLSPAPPWAQFSSRPEQVMAAVYVLADLGMLALGCTLLRGEDRGNTTLVLLAVGLGLTFLADALMDGIQLTGGDDSWAGPAPLQGGWLLASALMAAAVVHPAAGAATAPHSPRPVRLNRHAVLVLALAGLSVPAAAVWSHVQDDRDRTIALAVAGMLTLVVILGRLAVLVRAVQRQADGHAREARRDALTGLANRRTLDHSLQRAIRIARAENLPLCAAMIDLDHFKAFNDTHGHAGGDELLRRAAAEWTVVVQRRRMHPRHAAVLARYGGEEFALIALGADPLDLRETVLAMLGVTPMGQSFSAGVARWEDDMNGRDLLAAADEALYRAKIAGRRQVLVARAGSARV